MHGLIIFLPVVELKCAVQCYAWGKIGLKSAVAQLAQHSPSFKLEEDKPYSEVFNSSNSNRADLFLSLFEGCPIHPIRKRPPTC